MDLEAILITFISMSEEEKVQKIWEKGLVVPNYNPNIVRKDAAGAWIKRDKYNDRGSVFGWEIDHVVPKSFLEEKGFSSEQIDCLENLRPMNWKNNVSKGDDYPSYNVSVVAKEDTNVSKKGIKIVNSSVQSSLKALFGI